MAGPSGAILQSTKRGSRYWALRSQIQSGIAAAAARPVKSKPPATVETPDALGILEVVFMLPNRTPNIQQNFVYSQTKQCPSCVNYDACCLCNGLKASYYVLLPAS